MSKFISKPIKKTKEQLLIEINKLEVKADHYSRTDWTEYRACREKLKQLDMELLDLYTEENEIA